MDHVKKKNEYTNDKPSMLFRSNTKLLLNNPNGTDNGIRKKYMATAITIMAENKRGKSRGILRLNHRLLFMYVRNPCVSRKQKNDS